MRVTITSYVAAFASTVAGLTLQDWGVVVAIGTAIITCAAHLYYKQQTLNTYNRLAAAQEAEAKSHTVGGG
ncbi:hypothetical protein G3N59_05465 [Paraburkholderia sp. Ac-20340]|uniref:HP1 family phage holin n=1 Tax=Paraburkholderia sp. Ac-20340 TaxID=2703888 RepID=UPI0019810EF0|nr:HP1 family phage holin [Paraburkholderia sp. Ac-20340]MBN3852824.1 hypothetical protein [Paraburkholderia sp. Ac-20340]